MKIITKNYIVQRFTREEVLEYLKSSTKKLRAVPVMSERNKNLFSSFETSECYTMEYIYKAFAENRKKRHNVLRPSQDE